MHEEDRIERRVERAVFETDRQVVVGDVTLPPAGYQSRFSDSLNRGDLEFVPLTNVEITSLIDGKVSERPFVVLNKRHVRFSYPHQHQHGGPGLGGGPPAPGGGPSFNQFRA